MRRTQPLGKGWSCATSAAESSISQLYHAGPVPARHGYPIPDRPSHSAMGSPRTPTEFGYGGAPGPRAAAARLVDFLAFERNVVLVSATMFCMGLGEQLWRRFIPRYMQALGAPVSLIGLYGSAEDALDGLYQYPGGWLADRFGRRRTLVGLIGVAMLGYAAYAAAFAWPL